MKPLHPCLSVVAGALSFACASAACAAAVTPDHLPAPAKTHTLFMGVNVAIERDKTFYPVRDVSGGAFLITVKGEPVFVPTNLRSVNLKFDQLLKLTTKQAKIQNLKGDRAYTPEHDPNRKFLAAAGNASAGDAMVSMAAGRIVQTEFAASAARSSPQGPSAEQQQEVAKAYNDLAATTFSQGSDLNSVGNHALRLQEELAKELYDAIEVSFEVSSPTPLNNPYLLVITHFREPDAREGIVRNWIYAKSLPPITEAPQKVYVMQAGFPPGFKLVGYQVHLYNRGEEIATTVSPKQVKLSRDEALEYLIIEYVAANQTATLPPSLLTRELPPELHDRLTPEQLTQTTFVKVAKDGRVLGAFVDRECTQPVKAGTYEATLRSMRFKPALQQGKPVEAVASVALANLKT